MINNTPTEVRHLGRYALHWNHITDWYKANMRRRRTRREGLPPTDIVQPVSQPTVAIPAPTPDLADIVEPKPPVDKGAILDDKDSDKLIELEKRSHEVLYKATTVFPLVLFPDTIILDRTHLTITHRAFFGMAKITSVRIEDILTADLNVGPFFGALRVATRFFINQDTDQRSGSEIKSPSINYLWKRDALEVHKLLQGFIAATQRKIDTTQVPKPELVKLLRGLGENEDTKYEG